MKKVVYLSTLLLAVLVVMQGCATVVSKSKYPVEITSEPSEAKVSVTDRNGRVVHEGTTPTTATLKSGAGYFKRAQYAITFEKDGYKTKVVNIESEVDGWYVGGNFVISGLLGWLVIDPITGAMWTLRDDKEVHAELSSGSSDSALSSKGNDDLRIIAYNNLSEDMRQKLVKIN